MKTLTKLRPFLCLFLMVLHLPYGFAQTQNDDTVLDSLYNLVNDADTKKEKVKTILALCRHYKESYTIELDSLYYHANTALTLSDSDTDFQEEKVEALYYLARHAIEIEENNKAKSYITQIKSISEKISFGMGFVYAAKLSGRISYLENDLNMAFLNYEKAYQTAKDYKLPEPIIFNTALELIRIYSNNRYNKEIVAMLLFENVAIAENPNIAIKDSAFFYFYLGFYYDIYDIDVDKSIANYNKSIALYMQINDEIGLFSPLINLAESYQKDNDHHKAIETFNSAIAVDLGTRQADADSYIYYGLGLSYFELKDYDTSEYNLRKAAEANRIIKDPSGEADCLRLIGEIYLKKGSATKANTILNRAVEGYKKGVVQLRKQNPLNELISYAYEQISEIYELTNDYEKSLQYHTIYTAFNDSINNAQNTKVTERFKFLKEATEKNKEIETLENQNKIQQLKAEKEKTYKIGLLLFLGLIVLLLFVIINRYRLKQKALKIIQQKNEENKLLMREVHHRVKNNLQIISSLLSVQISNSENDKLKIILKESQNKIKSMSLIHQNLYMGNQFATVSVQSYIKELVHEIKNSYINNNITINFNLDITEKQIPIGLAVPLGLILNELIINAYKYAFIDKHGKEKKIGIRFHQLENTSRYSLIVKDNGKGLSADFNVDNLSSFGLQLVYGLTEQLHGEVKITQDKGTTFNIILEAPKEQIT
ncbi:histidine kinase dimerization/phosphoacceptor domain -containing protein [Maribacter sp. R77961]|uniref:tetratricopeptide repeat-containing sensor histidine kinase n=1 Tax=Maribacter sp. R77961 TaxID=3093871 RepID=UPI0037C6D58B